MLSWQLRNSASHGIGSSLLLPILQGILCPVLSVPVAYFVSVCLHPHLHPGLSKATWEEASLLGFLLRSWLPPRQFGVILSLQGQTGTIQFGSESSPSTFFQVPLSPSPPLIWGMDFGQNVSARRELDTFCGLSKREKGEISEGRREVRLLAELPHDLRTRETCREWVRSLELLLLSMSCCSLAYVCVRVFVYVCVASSNNKFFKTGVLKHLQNFPLLLLFLN